MTELTNIVRFKTSHAEGKSILSESEVPQSQEMIPLTDCLDDKGVALSSDLRSQVSKGVVIPYLRFPSGVEEYCPTQTSNGKVMHVPRGTTFVRDSQGGQTLGGLPMVSGGSI